jgi:predicted DNA-binding transcriptional regulator AlpA
MRKSKRKLLATSGLAGAGPIARADANEFIPGPKLRAKLGISAVTLWRWRHDKDSAFPLPKVIKGRLYFPADAVSAWLAKQPEAPWGGTEPQSPMLFGSRSVPSRETNQ